MTNRQHLVALRRCIYSTLLSSHIFSHPQAAQPWTQLRHSRPLTPIQSPRMNHYRRLQPQRTRPRLPLQCCHHLRLLLPLGLTSSSLVYTTSCPPSLISSRPCLSAKAGCTSTPPCITRSQHARLDTAMAPLLSLFPSEWQSGNNPDPFHARNSSQTRLSDFYVRQSWCWVSWP